MHIFKTALIITSLAACIYAVMFGLFTLSRQYAVTNAYTPIIDSYHARRDPCIRGPQAIIFYKNRITQTPNPKMIILGASNSRDGFRPDQIKDHLPSYEIHNLALSAANVSQMYEVVKFLKQTSARNTFENTIFTFGAVSGSLVSNKGRGWEESGGPFPSHINRLKEYNRNDDGNYKASINNALSQLSLTAHLPMRCLAINKALRKMKFKTFAKNIAYYFFKRDEEKDYKLKKISPEKRTKKIEDMANKIRAADSSENLYTEQVQKLYALNDMIEEMGGRLLIVEAPVPSWFRKLSPESQIFFGVMNELKKEKNLTIISINDGFTDDMFYDHAHPVTKTTDIWAQKLYEEMIDKEIVTQPPS